MCVVSLLGGLALANAKLGASWGWDSLACWACTARGRATCDLGLCLPRLHTPQVLFMDSPVRWGACSQPLRTGLCALQPSRMSCVPTLRRSGCVVPLVGAAASNGAQKALTSHVVLVVVVQERMPRCVYLDR